MKSIKKIYITGYMGSGKSYVASHLRKAINFDLIDLDQNIIDKTGIQIDEIFQKYGESHFRKLEFEALEKIETEERELVVALGGGSYCQSDIQELLNQSKVSFTVYLKHTPEFLVERLMTEKEHRPIIKEQEDLLGFVKQHLADREVFYNAADLILIDETDVDKICNQIRSYLEYQNQKLSTI